MNSIPFALHWAFHKLFTWFDNELSLRVAVITGEGKKAYVVSIISLYCQVFRCSMLLSSGLKMGPSSVLPADILEQDLRC